MTGGGPKASIQAGSNGQVRDQVRGIKSGAMGDFIPPKATSKRLARFSHQKKL
jgi:hypothetical protein